MLSSYKVLLHCLFDVIKSSFHCGCCWYVVSAIYGSLSGTVIPSVLDFSYDFTVYEIQNLIWIKFSPVPKCTRWYIFMAAIECACVSFPKWALSFWEWDVTKCHFKNNIYYLRKMLLKSGETSNSTFLHCSGLLLLL